MSKNKASTWGIGFRGFVTVGGVAIPHLVNCELQTTYSVQDNIPRYFSAGRFSIPYDKIRKVTLEWFGFSPLLMVKIGGASAAAGGNQVIEGETVDIVDDTATLDNVPLPDYDYPISLYVPNTDGTPERWLMPVTGTPDTDEFTIVNSTGVIVTKTGQFSDHTLLKADYLYDQAVDGFELVLGDDFAAEALDIVCVAGNISFSDGARSIGSLIIPQAIPLGEPPIAFGTGESKSASVEFSVKGNPSVYVE